MCGVEYLAINVAPENRQGPWGEFGLTGLFSLGLPCWFVKTVEAFKCKMAEPTGGAVEGLVGGFDQKGCAATHRVEQGDAWFPAG